MRTRKQNSSHLPTVKEDRDGCLSAKLSNLGGHFEVRWEGRAFLLRPFAEHFY